MKKEIFNPRGMAQSIRYTEYSNIYSALSEIIDNSIEAQAKNIIIGIKEIINDATNKKEINEICIIDDGNGMDHEILHECLVFGVSKSENSSIKIGRFGVGLGQASLFASTRVEVYSWRGNDSPEMVFLDTELMSKELQRYIDEPVVKEVPDPCKQLINEFNILYNHTFENGTLVNWCNVDKAALKASIFIKRLKIDLGRKFRYFIGNKCNIYVKWINSDAGFESISPIDPLFLMEGTEINSCVETPYKLSSVGEPLFEPFCCNEMKDGIKTFNINVDGTSSHVIIKCSLVKRKFYYEGIKNTSFQSPGNTEIGKLVKKHEGISIVRSGREIDFGRFKIYDAVNEPRHRWWGIEVSFKPILDDFFKVSNNKQHVDISTNADEDGTDWEEIFSFLQNIIKLMKKKLNEYMKDVKTPEDCDKEKENGDAGIKIKRFSKCVEEESKRNNDVNITDKIIFLYNSLGKKTFKVDGKGNKKICTINSKSDLGEKLMNNDLAETVFKILIGQLLKIENSLTSYDDIIVFNKIIDKYINEIERIDWSAL